MRCKSCKTGNHDSCTGIVVYVGHQYDNTLCLCPQCYPERVQPPELDVDIIRAKSIAQAKLLYNRGMKETTDRESENALDSALRKRIGDGEFFAYLTRRERREK